MVLSRLAALGVAAVPAAGIGASPATARTAGPATAATAIGRGAPCSTGSTYQAFTYVEVWNPGGGDSDEFVSETLLRC